MQKRLLGFSSALGAVLSAVTVSGAELMKYGAFRPFSWGHLFAGLGLFVLLAAVYGAALAGLFWLMDRQAARELKKESLLSRLSGNGFVVFVLLMLCWFPAFLTFFPGWFSADSLVQFESFYNGDPYSHHPLLHTALLGFCMVKGIGLHPEGYATYGVALYTVVQMVLLAACVAYACWWMKRRRVPVWARLTVTLFFALWPFYHLWPICAQKDVLFAALVLLFCLQMVDLWHFGMKPVRLVFFVIIAVLMMLFRNNGVYALVVLIPFAVWWAKGRRIRMGALLAGCAALYLIVNTTMVTVMEAQPGSKVEMLSIPLQQMARTLRDDPEAIELDEDGVLDTLYHGRNPAELYHVLIADPVKWEVDYDLLDENIPALLKLWARMGVGHLKTYIEAFMAQNLPYILPYAEMEFHFDLAVKQPVFFPIEQFCLKPELYKPYMKYIETLNVLEIPGTRLLSDTAFFVWLTLIGLVYAAYRRERGLMMAFGFLLAVWITCLLGPVALFRYMLCVFYTTPVLFAYLLIPGRNVC